MYIHEYYRSIDIDEARGMIAEPLPLCIKKVKVIPVASYDTNVTADATFFFFFITFV